MARMSKPGYEIIKIILIINNLYKFREYPGQQLS